MSLFDLDRTLAADSYYAATVPAPPRHAPLQGHGACDVAIVGGGLAGLSAAIELADRGFGVRLLEARTLGHGASGRNGGQVIHGLACDIADIERQLGPAAAREVFAMSLEAIALIHARCERFGIDAEWRSGWLSVATSERKARALRAAGEWLERRHAYPMTWIARDELPRWIASPRYVAGCHDPRSGHLHPLKYTLGLARAAQALGVGLHEHSPVQAIEHGPQPVVRTAQGSLRCRHLLLAGNVYLEGLAPAIRARVMAAGTHIIASAPVGAAMAQRLIPCGAAVCDTNHVLDYFRFSADHRLLYGGRVSHAGASPQALADQLARRMRQTFPALAATPVEHAWGGFVDLTMNRAPDFGRLGPARNVYYLQGFSGHGLALTGLAGRLVAEAIAGDAGRFDVFARLKHRPFPGGRWLRRPSLMLGMAWYRLRDALP